MKDKRKTALILNENDQLVESEEVGIPTMFQPSDWDVEEEMQNNEAFRDFQKENQDQF